MMYLCVFVCICVYLCVFVWDDGLPKAHVSISRHRHNGRVVVGVAAVNEFAGHLHVLRLSLYVCV